MILEHVMANYFRNRKDSKGRGLQVLQVRMKTMELDQKEIYKFLGVEQGDGIKTKEIYNRVKEEVNRRIKVMQYAGKTIK